VAVFLCPHIGVISRAHSAGDIEIIRGRFHPGYQSIPAPEFIPDIEKIPRSHAAGG